MLVVFAAVVLLVISAVQVLTASRASPATSAVGPASAVIVVGTPTGSQQATGDLKARCAQALVLWRAHRASVVITTGGPSTPGAPTEASLAASWLLAQGLPRRDLQRVANPNLGAAFASIAKRYGKAAGHRTILVGAPLQVFWLKGLSSAEGLDAQVSPVSASRPGLMTDVRQVWFQAVAVGLGRVVGFDNTQGFGE